MASIEQRSRQLYVLAEKPPAVLLIMFAVEVNLDMAHSGATLSYAYFAKQGELVAADKREYARLSMCRAC
jgi:hypothetical protein